MPPTAQHLLFCAHSDGIAALLVHNINKNGAGFVTMTGPAAHKTLPTKNPPAQPIGFENLFSALAVSFKRPQAEYQIGAAVELLQKLTADGAEN